MSTELRLCVYDEAIEIVKHWLVRNPSNTEGNGWLLLKNTGKLNAPFLGLTQSCKLARSEFRTKWPQNIVVDVAGLRAYFWAFVELPRTQFKVSAQTCAHNIGAINLDAFRSFEVDLVPLLKLKALHPKLFIPSFRSD